MSTFINSLQKVLLRDLDKLQQEISLYPVEESLWIIKGDIKNPAGNLCLHLCGNLQNYIGKILGGSNYQRNRDAEFSLRNVPRQKLISEITNTKEAIQNAFKKLSDTDLEKTYPENVLGESMTTQYFLIHLAAHLNYHLGQVNYHRRLTGS